MSDTAKNEKAVETTIVGIERGSAAAELENRNLDPNKGKVGFYSSLDTSTTTGKIRAYRAMSGDAKPIDQFLDKVILVENYVVHPVDLTDPLTGEIHSGIRVVLIAPNGVMYGCVSVGILDSLRKLCSQSLYGPMPWKGGLQVVPKMIRTKAKRIYYFLDVALGEETATEQPKPTPAAKQASK